MGYPSDISRLFSLVSRAMELEKAREREMQQIAVVGAGVIGMTSAVAIKSAFPHLEVSVLANVFSPQTTGDGSAGLWGPYLCGETPPEDIRRWAGSTHRWFEELWKSGLARQVGISLLPVVRATSRPEGYLDRLDWISFVYGACKLDARRLKRLNEEHGSNYSEAWQFLTYTAEPSRLLPWLTKRFVASGGRIEKRTVRSFDELASEGYRTIINCTGLGAKELAGDIELSAIRGQIVKVKAPWAMHGYLVDDDDGNYVIPNIDATILGGTHQDNDLDDSARKEDSIFIYEGCYRMQPFLKRAPTLTKWVGFRPGRPRVRLEIETFRKANEQQNDYLIVHNYGHGGSGVTLSWGCALDIVESLRTVLPPTLLSSNL